MFSGFFSLICRIGWSLIFVDPYWSLLFVPLVDTFTAIRHNLFGLHKIFGWWRADIHISFWICLLFPGSQVIQSTWFRGWVRAGVLSRQCELPLIASVSRDNLQSLCPLASHTDAVAMVVVSHHPLNSKILLMTWKIAAQQSNICWYICRQYYVSIEREALKH